MSRRGFRASGDVLHDALKDRELAQAVGQCLAVGASFMTGLPEGSPLVVSYGMGEDSTALLVGLWLAGVRPHSILFSDVGNEKENTYAYLPIISAWLEWVGFPPVTVVSYKPKKFKNRPYRTLAGNCLANWTLPGIAFGFKSCSLKWKGEILDKWVRDHVQVRAYRAIGYDCSPRDSKRFALAQKKEETVDQFVYPLQAWGWTRDVCQRVTALAGLPNPGKSSCYFCTSMKPWEVNELPVMMLRQIVIIEANAWANLRTTQGLWRDSSMTEYIVQEELLPEHEANALWERWADPTTWHSHAPDVNADDILAIEAADEFVAETVEQWSGSLVWTQNEMRPRQMNLL
jgi:hypothetical protein